MQIFKSFPRECFSALIGRGMWFEKCIVMFSRTWGPPQACLAEAAGMLLPKCVHRVAAEGAASGYVHKWHTQTLATTNQLTPCYLLPTGWYKHKPIFWIEKLWISKIYVNSVIHVISTKVFKIYKAVIQKSMSDVISKQCRSLLRLCLTNGCRCNHFKCLSNVHKTFLSTMSTVSCIAWFQIKG